MGNKETAPETSTVPPPPAGRPGGVRHRRGPEQGDLLNIAEEGALLKTAEKISVDREIRITIDGKQARGKAMWSLADESGNVETGVRFLEVSEDFLKEIKEKLKE